MSASTPPIGRRRSTRDRPAKSPLSEAAVVDAALTILQTAGLEAVTMRSVAVALDTGPASLYVYVAGREGLLAAMLDGVTSTVTTEDPDPATWRAQLHGLLDRLYAALAAHPGIAGVTLATPPATPAVLRVTENLLGILLAGGLPPQDAAWGCDIFVLLATAAAREDDIRHPLGDDRGTARDHYARLTDLADDTFPLVKAHAAQLVAGDTRERLHYAVDTVLDGMLVRSAG